MTQPEQITSLKEEVEKLKKDLEAERTKNASFPKEIEQLNKIIKESDDKIKELNDTIEELASAPAATSTSAAATGFEFKHKGELYSLNMPAEANAIIPGFGSKSGKEISENADILAYLVRVESDSITKL